MTKNKRNIIIITAAVIAVIGIVLAIVLPLTLNRHEGETYTVTFNSNGGTAVESITGVEYNSLIKEPSAPTKVGYAFDGWFKDTQLNSQWRFASDRVKSDITLYARWEYNATTGLLMLPNGNEYTVAGVGDITDVANIVIPDTYNGLPVTTIAKEAFANQSSIETVFMPNSIKNIFGGAFSNCGNLTEITLPEGLTVIESNMFYECRKLAAIEIPANVTSIGDFAFGTCESLTEIALPASLQTLGEKVFSGCSKLEKLSVDSRNTYFYSRDNGTDLNCIIAVSSNSEGKAVNKLVVGCNTSRIPANSSRPVTVIGEAAFCGSGIERITIPYGVTTIEDEAFQGCKNLEGITFPASVTTIGDYAFSSCESLLHITFTSPSEGSADTGIQILGQEVFSHCFSLSNPEGAQGVHLPSSLTSVGAGLFHDCDLEHITITYGDDASKLQTLIADGKDGNDDYTTLVTVTGDRGSSATISGLA